MRVAIKVLGLVVLTAVSGITLLPVGLSHAASGPDVIKARIAFMEDEVEAHWRTLAAYVKAGQGSLADIEKSARALANLAKKIPAHFPKDTGRGNFPDDVTRSLPIIWKDWSGFEKEVQRLATESEKLAVLAKAGDREAVLNMIGPTGTYNRTKIGCAECHETYRGARPKK